MDDELNELLPFLLRRENVCRYESGCVTLLDRREYPFRKEYLELTSVESVAKAIEEMAITGWGPWVAAAYAMVMAAEGLEHTPGAGILNGLREAARRLAQTRPTNTLLHRVLDLLLEVAAQAVTMGASVPDALLDWVEQARDLIIRRAAQIGQFGAALIEDGDGILTMCFPEHGFMFGIAYAKRDGKCFHVYTPETRPFLQGARYTAPSLHEMGVPAIVITDNMPAHVLSEGKVQRFLTCADLVTMSGHVVNKIGTLQNAIACKFFGVPYHVYALTPDPTRLGPESIQIETRQAGEIRSIRGVKTTLDAIECYYPAFDITPPNLVSGVICEFGVIPPEDLATHYRNIDSLI